MFFQYIVERPNQLSDLYGKQTFLWRGLSFGESGRSITAQLQIGGSPSSFKNPLCFSLASAIVLSNSTNLLLTSSNQFPVHPKRYSHNVKYSG
jgi:hypothetical protein